MRSARSNKTGAAIELSTTYNRRKVHPYGLCIVVRGAHIERHERWNYVWLPPERAIYMTPNPEGQILGGKHMNNSDWDRAYQRGERYALRPDEFELLPGGAVLIRTNSFYDACTPVPPMTPEEMEAESRSSDQLVPLEQQAPGCPIDGGEANFQKVAAKISALLNKTVENGATEEEAQAAAAKAHKLLKRLPAQITHSRSAR